MVIRFLVAVLLALAVVWGVAITAFAVFLVLAGLGLAFPDAIPDWILNWLVDATEE